tara:strand:+ start:2913 stop:3656 length:744 start_codon:yes stop_codon:yes gene_type:complete
MKILVCISKTPDTTSKISFTDNNTKFDTSNVQYIINPYDEWYALVRAIELKEQNGGTVTTITVGTAADEAVAIRKALAIGADDAVRINAEAGDAYYTAFQIAEYAKENQYDIIFTGKETIDYNGSQVGGMIAEILNSPFISYASKLDKEGDNLLIEREIEGGKETIQASTPVVISAAKGLAEQRIPNMRGIMQARMKPLKVVEPKECLAFTDVVSYEIPSEKSACRMVDSENISELVSLLKNEAKVI